MSLRAATIADIDTLVFLHESGFSPGWDRTTIRDFVEQDLVFVIGEPIVGLIIARCTLDEAEIITLVIEPSARHGGHGQRLVNHALKILAQNEVTRTFLEVASDNDAAIGLYLKAGFTQVGLRKAYYARTTGPACDALIMSKQSSL